MTALLLSLALVATYRPLVDVDRKCERVRGGTRGYCPDVRLTPDSLVAVMSNGEEMVLERVGETGARVRLVIRVEHESPHPVIPDGAPTIGPSEVPFRLAPPAPAPTLIDWSALKPSIPALAAVAVSAVALLYLVSLERRITLRMKYDRDRTTAALDNLHVAVSNILSSFRRLK